MIDIKININGLTKDDITKQFLVIENYVNALKNNNGEVDNNLETDYLNAINVLKNSFSEVTEINKSTNFQDIKETFENINESFSNGFFNVFGVRPMTAMNSAFDKTKESFYKMRDSIKQTHDEFKVKIDLQKQEELEKLRAENAKLKESLRAFL